MLRIVTKGPDIASIQTDDADTVQIKVENNKLMQIYPNRIVRWRYMITPLEIQNKEFKRGIRGYREDEVDEFLDKIIIDYEKLYKENMELKDKLEGVHHQLEQYKELEETLKKTLVVAQDAAEDVRLNSQKESELIIQEAEAKAKEIIDKANSDVENIRGEFENIKNQMQIFKTRFKALLQSQLDSIAEACDDLESEN